MKQVRLALLAVLFGTIGALCATHGVGAQTAPVVPSPEAVRTLTIATLAPEGSTWMRVFESWGRAVRLRTHKQLALRFYPGGVQGDEAEVIHKIQSGRLDGAAVTAVGLGQIAPQALVFQIPGLIHGYDELDNARRGMNTEMTGLFDAAGFTLVGWADVGIARPFSVEAIHGPADLARMHPWLWPDDRVGPALLDVLNAHGVRLQVPEVLTALQTHRIDAFVASPVATLALQWNTQVHFMTNLDTAITIGATVFGSRQFNSLTPEQQQIVRETATQFHALLVRNLRNDEHTALQTLGDHGISVVELTEAQRSAWMTVFAQTRARLVGHIADAAFIHRVEAARLVTH